MVDIEVQLARRIMLLSHERGLEMGTDEVISRADELAVNMRKKGMPADRIYALELMSQLLDSENGT
jgi:hypothetical protein